MAVNSRPYMKILTEGAVENFVSRFMGMHLSVQCLVLVSPFISDLSGKGVCLKDILDKAKRDGAKVYVVTRPASELYQTESMVLLCQYPNVEVRHNDEVHAKLYICWCKDEEESFALFGSGNLTKGGMRYNLELGMMILARDHGRKLVRDLYTWSHMALRSKSKLFKGFNKPTH